MLKLWFYAKKINRHFSQFDPDICCCGSMIPDHGYCTFPGACRSQAEYCATTAIEKKRKELSL